MGPGIRNRILNVSFSMCLCPALWRFVVPVKISVRRTPHSVIVTIRDNKDYIRVLLYSYYTTITGWGVLLRYLVYMVCFGRGSFLSRAL